MSAPAEASASNPPSDDKSDGEVTEQARDSKSFAHNSNTADANRTIASLAVLQERFDQASMHYSASTDDGVTMILKCSKTAGIPRDSPLNSPRRNSSDPPPATPPSDDDMNGDTDSNTVVNITGNGDDVKTYFPPSDFDNFDTTGRDDSPRRSRRAHLQLHFGRRRTLCTPLITPGSPRTLMPKIYLFRLIHIDGAQFSM